MIKKLRKGIVGNVFLNTVASALPILLLQLIVLPYVGGIMSENEYGLLITILALLNVVPVTLGNSLNNIRLLYRKEYEEKQLEGDFNILFLCETIVDIVIVAGVSIYYLRTGSYEHIAFHVIAIVVVSVLWITREYYIVSFLLEIRYDFILINNVLLAVGYVIGTLLYRFTGIWEFIYITGYCFSLSFIFWKSRLWKERLIKTQLFSKTLKENLTYIVACLLYRIPTYADKMLLYPVLGGALTSIYYVATLSGKVVSLIITPISGVMLSYLSREKEKNTKQFNIVLGVGTVVSILGYLLCLVASKPILTLLYPQYVEAALKYIFVTTATVVISVLISIVNPYVLRFFFMKWQVLINLITITVYIGLSLYFLKLWGLLGFCLGAMISNLVKLIVMIMIYYLAKNRVEPEC